MAAKTDPMKKAVEAAIKRRMLEDADLVAKDVVEDIHRKIRLELRNGRTPWSKEVRAQCETALREEVTKNLPKVIVGVVEDILRY